MESKMDLCGKLKYQQNVLTCDNYVNYIWDKIHKEIDDESENEEDSEHFYNHIPLKFDEFLAQCNHLLLNSGAVEFSLDESNKKYLATLLLTGLKEVDVSSEAQSVPSQAAVLYLSIAAMDDGSIFDVVTLNHLFAQMLQFFQRRNSYSYPISAFMFICLNKFLQDARQEISQKNLHRLLCLLQMSIANVPITVDNFDLDEDAHRIHNKAVFICFKTVVEKQRTDAQAKEIITRICILLISHTNGNVNIKETIKHFFKFVLHKNVKYNWYVKLLTLLLEHITDVDDFFVEVINEIRDTDQYYWIVINVLNNFVRYPNKNFDVHLNTLYGIIKFPHGGVSDDVKDCVIKKIIRQLFFKSADEDMKIKEMLLNIFIELFRLKDIHVKRYLQQFFHDDASNRVSAKVLFAIFESQLDVKWKQTTYNASFMTLACEMFLRNKDFISAYRLKVIELLCSRATAFSLQPCVPVVIDVIKRYAAENNPVIRPLLRILIDNALKPTTAANYYIKEIFDLISNVMTTAVDCDEAIAVCNVILTDDFDFVNLMKMFHVHNLITCAHVQVLLEEKALKKKPAVWQLLSLLLDLNYYVPIPPYIQHLILSCASAELYGKPESFYVVQVIGKVFAKELQGSCVSDESKTFAFNVERMLQEHVKRRHVPMKHINNVIIVLLTVQKITESDTEWMKLLFYESLDVTLTNISSEIDALIVQRNLSYVSSIYTLMKFSIEESYMVRLQQLAKCDDQEVIDMSDGITWGLFVVFYGRICMKIPTMISPNIPYFQFAITHGTPYVQQIALFALHDICSIRLSHYEAFESVIMNLVQSEHVEVKITAVKVLIQLINDNHIRVDGVDFISFMLILIDRQLKMCLHYKDILEKDFFHRNENLISKYFVHLLFYLNNYQNHPEYSIKSDKLKSQEYTYERRSIVLKLLFGMLQRYNQFQILSVLNTEVLSPIYTGEMPSTHNVLNIFRDVLNVVSVTAMQYINEDIVINEEFHEKLLQGIRKDFLSRSRPADIAQLDFNNITEQLMLNLLQILHKIERFNRDLLPVLYNVIAIATKAYYERLQYILQSCVKLRDLYSELPNFYESYKEIIIAEPMNILSWEKEEWQMYLEYTD